ncbi:retrovirus-related pol polyprotein from transposon TNT 1-94 [Tanacetum coccineum]
METKDTLSSCSDLDEQEIQQLQKQAKDLKEISMNKLNALKITTQRLERKTFTHSLLFERSFSRLFSNDVRTFKYELSQNMNNLEKRLNNEILHEKDSKSALSVISVEFDKFIHSEMLKSSNYDSNAREARQDFKDYTQMEAKSFKDLIIQHMESIKQCIVERERREQEIHNWMKRLNERKLQIQEFMVKKVKASDASSGEKDCSRIVSDKENDQGLENQSNTFGDESNMSRNERNDKSTSRDDTDIRPSYDTKPMVEVPYTECDDERAVLANLIANLKLDVDENKKIQKQLKKANASLAHELKECKSILAETSRTLRESNSIRDSCLIALQNKQTEFERYKALNDRTVDYDKLERKLIETLGLLAQKEIDIKEGLKVKAYEISVAKEKHDEELVDQAWEKHSHNHFRAPTALDMEVLIKTCLMPLAIKTQNDSFTFVHELKQEMHADLKYVESLENEIDELESDKAEFSNMYDILLQECVSNDVMCSYLHSLSDLDAHSELQCLYLHKVKECECLAQKLSKQTESNIAISDLKKLIEKCKGKSVETKFDKPSVVRQPNAQRIPKPSVLGKPAPFSDSLERKKISKNKSVPKTNESEGLSKPVTSQNLPQTATQAVRNTNVIKPGMYRIDTRTTQTRAPQLPQTSRNTNPRVSTSTGVNHRTNVSRPQLKSTQMKDKVVPNTSQVKFKKTEVEDHHRISSISNQSKSVTACNDSLKSKTSNVNVVCGTCGKCVFNSNHDACVSKYLNDVNARTKKPKVVPISTRKPKSQANKSVATHRKKTVASESTVQNSKSYYRMLYEKTSKAWKWWIEQQCPSGYTWVPKKKMKWIVQLILFIVDSGCTKHMTGNISILCNFVEKYLGTVCFGNDQFAPILGYGDLVQGNITINRVYYVEGLNHNLFSVGQFCDADLEVAFRKSTCFVRDLQGNDLLIGNRGSDLYTISLQETTSSTPICLMAKASPTQAWLWHRRLSHLNFDYINLLSKKDVVIGLPKLKYVKDQLCSSCEVSKAKRSSFKTKTVPSSKGRGTEFLNKTLHAFFKEEGIEHQTSTPRTPEQNGVVERRNRTLVEAARTMLSASKLPLFFWAEAIATACYT